MIKTECIGPNQLGDLGLVYPNAMLQHDDEGCFSPDWMHLLIPWDRVATPEMAVECVDDALTVFAIF